MHACTQLYMLRPDLKLARFKTGRPVLKPAGSYVAITDPNPNPNPNLSPAESHH